MGHNYAQDFERFFQKGVFVSDYKLVFLHALLDIGMYDQKELIGKQWITERDGKISLDLDFLAIRFIKSYWDISTLNIKHTSSRNQVRGEINILKKVRSEKKEISDAITLERLASPEMADFRKDVISFSIKPEVLKNLKKDFEGYYEVSGNSVIFDTAFGDYLMENRPILLNKIWEKTREFLDRLNPEYASTHDVLIDEHSPFFRYWGAGAR